MILTKGVLLHNRYRIQDLLGQGGMGSVYHAYDIVLDHACAVKEMIPLSGLDVLHIDGLRKQFRQEAQVLAKLDHPSLPHVIDYFAEKGNEYLVMDFVEGESLEELIANSHGQGLPEEKVLTWADQLLEALAQCHALGVVHRDIKPANIIIRSDPAKAEQSRAVLVDFGLVKQWGPDRPQTQTVIQGVGTPEYAPPEQYGGGAGHTEPRSDIYSLGASLYQALTGQAPPTATKRMATPRSFQPPRALQRRISARTERAILKALALPVEERFQSAGSMAAYLRGSTLLPVREPTGPRKALSQLRWPVLVLLGLMLVGLSVLSIAFFDWPIELAMLLRTATNTPTVTLTLVPTMTPTFIPSSALTPSPTPSPAPCPTTSPTPTATPEPTDTLQPTVTPEPTSTLEPGSVPIPRSSDVATDAPLPTPLPEPTHTAQPTPLPRPTATVQVSGPGLATEDNASSESTGSLTGRIAIAVYNAGIGSYTLYTVNPDGSDLHAFADNVHHPDYSPDGTRLVVDGVGGGRDDLWSLNVDGSNWHQATAHPDDHFPNWSPNGLVIGFSSTRQGDGVSRLYVNDEPVGTDGSKFILGEYPVWLPNWEFVFNGCDYGWGPGTHCGLWHGSQDHTPVQVTESPQDIPVDGTSSEILFLRPEGSNWDIYRISLGGGVPKRLTDGPGRDGPATYSPDGQTIAFLSDRSGTWALYTMNRQGRGVQKRLDLPMGGNYDAAPNPWNSERLSWGRLPAGPTPVPTSPDAGLLPAPVIQFPIPDDTVSSSKSTEVRWSWTQELDPNLGFQVRFWHVTDASPLGIAPPTAGMRLKFNVNATDAYQRKGEGFYYLDVVVVQLEPYQVLSRSAPIRVKTSASK